MELVYTLILGGIAGWLAGRFMQGGGFGVLGNVVIGLLGGVVGGFVFGLLGIGSDGSLIGSLVTAFVGAVVLLYVVALFKKKD